MRFLNQALGMGLRAFQVAGPLALTMSPFPWVHDPRPLDSGFHEQPGSTDPRLVVMVFSEKRGPTSPDARAFHERGPAACSPVQLCGEPGRPGVRQRLE